MKALPSVLCALVLFGCDGSGGSTGSLGTEVMGNYTLHAQGIRADCTLPDLPASLDFSGVFSRSKDGGVFFATNGNNYLATFDGQVASYVASGSNSYYLRDGGACTCAMTQTVRMSVALLSSSQAAVFDGGCPAHPLDGGVPGPDAGVSLPDSTDAGFDAVLACGEERVEITGEGFCDPNCYSCVLQYRVSGARR